MVTNREQFLNNLKRYGIESRWGKVYYSNYRKCIKGSRYSIDTEDMGVEHVTMVYDNLSDCYVEIEDKDIDIIKKAIIKFELKE